MNNYANQEAVQFYTQALEWDMQLPKPENKQALHDRQVRRARWHSRIGLAHYGLGSLPDCDKHVREALRLLETPFPNSNLQLTVGLIPQIIRQVFHRFFPARYTGQIKNEKEREVATEISRLYEFMSRVYFYSSETLPIIYTVLRFVNEAERTGTTPELATAYSSFAVLMGYAQLHGLAEAYVKRGTAVARKVNEPSNIITVNVVTGVYKLMVGKWDDTRTLAAEAKALCEELGDDRQWGDSTVLMAESAFISGDVESALKIEQVLLEDARRRRNPLQQCWALFGVAAILNRRGD